MDSNYVGTCLNDKENGKIQLSMYTFPGGTEERRNARNDAPRIDILWKIQVFTKPDMSGKLK